MAIKLKVNGLEREVDADPDTPLLWVLREQLNLTGTKYGCGIGQCGACTVHLAGSAVRSCSLPVAALNENLDITTIEGLGFEAPHAVQQAWSELDVPQCGYCQPGMIMAASSLLKKIPNPSEEEIKSFITNICRCGTYGRVMEGIKRASVLLADVEAKRPSEDV